MTRLEGPSLWYATRWPSGQSEGERVDEEQEHGIHADHDRDGVPDETERWLGTSNFTDESGVSGRTDSGGVASGERVERWERALDATDEKERLFKELRRGSDDERAQRHALGERPAPLSSSSLGLLMAQLVATDVLKRG